MSYTVTLTNQGQISVPAELRRKLSLSGGDTLILRDISEGKVSMERVPDILELAGSLKKYAKNAKGKSFRQMRKEYEEYLGTRLAKRGNFPFPHVSSIK